MIEYNLLEWEKFLQKRKEGIDVKGYQKRVIFLKNTGSPLFEEAYFVIRAAGESSEIGQSDMVFEANKIISESLGDLQTRLRRERVERKRAFLIPFFLGVLITVACAMVFYTVYILFRQFYG